LDLFRSTYIDRYNVDCIETSVCWKFPFWQNQGQMLWFCIFGKLVGVNILQILTKSKKHRFFQSHL
jgi:hypothetical protein